MIIIHLINIPLLSNHTLVGSEIKYPGKFNQEYMKLTQIVLFLG
jgi:hypothetical protein